MPLATDPCKIFYGTQKFSSPEALKGLYELEKQEVWALGTLLYVLLFKMDPFASDDEILDLDIGHRIERLAKGGNKIKAIKVSSKAVEAIVTMLCKDAIGRPAILELLELPFLQ